MLSRWTFYYQFMNIFHIRKCGQRPASAGSSVIPSTKFDNTSLNGEILKFVNSSEASIYKQGTLSDI